MLAKNINNRVKGAYPISIPTSLALESILHPPNMNEDIPKNKLNSPAIILFNVATIVRNFLNASDIKISDELLKSRDLILLADRVTAEMNVITGILGEASHQFYVTTLVNNPKPSWALRTGQAAKSASILHQLINFISPAYYLVLPDKMGIIDLKYHVYLFTHYTADLLWRSDFNAIYLLESHTGKIKPHGEFNTKFYPIPKDEGVLNRIPFNKVTLAIFGDRHLIKPMPLLFRREVLTIAKKNKWHVGTSLYRVNHDLSKFKKEITEHAASH